ncbi:MAG: succinate dehydrogenase cytochrome b subunit [Acidobacteria bacterium]|nr:succinate dehydrogenase cytochrome b subunit [Acidobacteriota bacterium]
MSSPRLRLLGSSVATKLLIGITGLALVLYLIVHVVGNLLIFLGPDFFNRYAYTLEGNPLLPIVEIGLLLVFLIHILRTIRNFVLNQRARPVRYVEKRRAGWPSRKSFPSSTMIVSGLWLVAFLLVHVKAFRYGAEYPWPAGGRDLYRLELETFRSPLVVAFYAISMVVIGAHLWHGIASGFQSLGADTPAWRRFILPAGKIVAVAIAGAFIVIAIWAHLQGAA